MERKINRLERKHMPTTSVTIHLPENMPKEDQEKMRRAILEDLSKKQAQEQRDWDMYQKGRRDGGFGGSILRGLF